VYNGAGWTDLTLTEIGLDGTFFYSGAVVEIDTFFSENDDVIGDRNYTLADFATPGVYSDGFSTLTVTATPEPGTAILWLTGIALMILTRKRIAHLFRLDTGTQGSSH
jgi:hypothetical protein